MASAACSDPVAAGELCVRVATATGEEVASLPAESDWSVADVKGHVARIVGTNAWQLQLLIGSDVLKSDTLLSEVDGIARDSLTLVTLAGIDLTYAHDLDTNGVFYFIGTEAGQREWQNPAEAGHVFVERSERGCGRASDAVGRKIEDCHTPNVQGAWWSFDLSPTRRLIPNYYTIRHKKGMGCNYLRNWVLEAQNQNDDIWITLVNHVNDASLQGQRDWDDDPPVASWPVQSDDAFQYFRIRMTGSDSSGAHHLCCSGFELYGKLFIDY
eukprot:TRINITY_DN58200_c0_g1_i1.p1 TRINITY_DN58200_c0_g1~~TRINITY_DN58200_c0_g1_i1.p1  ORF type:complete len:289 (+),score=36.72 TRINITY_DN58200_c0_g1_i1:58-867(+)